MRDRYTIARKAVACGRLLTTVLAGASAAQAQSCSIGPEGFDRWLAAMRSQAARQGISQSAIDRSLAGVSYDRTVIRLDRNQRSFKLSFEQFYARRVGSALISRARQRLAGLLQRGGQS